MMEDYFDMVDTLFEHGNTTYTTFYKDYYFTVSIRLDSRKEEYYNYVFSVFGIREALVDMLEQSIPSQQDTISFTACMSEMLEPIEVDVEQIPVHRLRDLEVIVIKSKYMRNEAPHSVHITTQFNKYHTPS